MDHITLLSLTPEELNGIVTDALSAELDRRQIPKAPEQPSSATSSIETMTRSEVLTALRCTPPTLILLERRKELSPCVRLGRKPLWLRRDVERYLGGNR